MKKRIVIDMMLLIAFSLTLMTIGLLLLLWNHIYNWYWIFAWILVVLFVAAILAQYCATRIVMPIQAMALESAFEENVYEEIRPLLQYAKQQRKQIDETITELEGKQREFSTLTEHMHEGFVVINAQGCILSMNPCAIRILGLQNQTDCEKQRTYIMEHNLELQKQIEEGLKGIHQDSMIEQDGRIYQVVTNPIGSIGQPQGIVMLLIDVTEKQQQEQLRREFTANVSHELRTPLTTISGYAEIMMQGLVPAERMQPFAENIYKEANRLIALIADIIQLSQLDEEAKQFQRETVDVAQLAEDTVKRLLPKAENQEITLTVYTEPAIMVGVAQVVQEIIYNLCDNAIKYNRPNGTVKVSVVQSNGSIILKVMDSGIGIALEDQSRVFERFYRADKSHSSLIGGTGLGLSIVKHGVQLHHGEIQLESQLQVGTVITVRLPVK